MYRADGTKYRAMMFSCCLLLAAGCADQSGPPASGRGAGVSSSVAGLCTPNPSACADRCDGFFDDGCGGYVQCMGTFACEFSYDGHSYGYCDADGICQPYDCCDPCPHGMVCASGCRCVWPS